MKDFKLYVKGNIAFPSGVINRLIMLGGEVVEEFKEIELANPINLFYIDFYNNNEIKKVTADSVMGTMMLQFWEEFQPFTYIDEPESLPASWNDAIEKCIEAQIYNRGDNTELNEKLNILGRLITLRDIYRQGWTQKSDKFCYYIEYDLNNNDLFIMRGIGKNYLISFQDTELTEQFLENFKNDILKCKEML